MLWGPRLSHHSSRPPSLYPVYCDALDSSRGGRGGSVEGAWLHVYYAMKTGISSSSNKFEQPKTPPLPVLSSLWGLEQTKMLTTIMMAAITVMVTMTAAKNRQECSFQLKAADTILLLVFLPETVVTTCDSRSARKTCPPGRLRNKMTSIGLFSEQRLRKWQQDTRPDTMALGELSVLQLLAGDILAKPSLSEF